MKLPMHRTLVARLTGLFALLLMLFAVVLELLFNAMMERKMIAHYSKTMQRNAYAISQNLSEMIAPSDYEALDENPFIVGEDTLAPYMALIEHITNCNVYLIDEQHRVTGYFDGVVQTMSGRVLPPSLTLRSIDPRDETIRMPSASAASICAPIRSPEPAGKT